MNVPIWFEHRATTCGGVMLIDLRCAVVKVKGVDCVLGKETNRSDRLFIDRQCECCHLGSRHAQSGGTRARTPQGRARPGLPSCNQEYCPCGDPS